MQSDKFAGGEPTSNYASNDKYLKEWFAVKETSEKFFVTSVCLLLTASVLIEPMNRTIHEVLWFGGKVSSGIGSLAGPGSSDEKLKVGDKVGRFPVSSPYGWREHPVTGGKVFHKGVDLATPVGTKLYAPVEKGQVVNVECWTDDGGGGLVATIKDGREDGSVELLHLSDCTTGEAKGGDVIALSGNTGTGTGPHLHLQEKDRDGETFEPRKSIAIKVIGK